VKKAAGPARDKAVQEVNKRLLAEGRKNQCSFKVDSAQQEHGCDKKLKNLDHSQLEMVARGIPQNEIISVGRGADQPLVTPDDTPAKKAKNRRYEIQVRF